MPRPLEFTLEFNITTTNGFLSVECYPLEADDDSSMTHDELMANDPEVISQLKSAVFNVLRNVKFTGN